MTRALVIGKFLPPHRGHRYLMERARAEADELVVIVCHKEGQPIPGELRREWIREMEPSARVLVVEDAVPADDSRGWAEYTMRILGEAPDVVCTSEGYGEAYARFLGCRHVAVDPERSAFPVSGTMVREAPLACWEYLDPCVRGWYAVRVCVVGAESTGTTTLARDLAAHYGTAWVPEYGRLYYEGRQGLPEPRPWTTEEFVHIAAQQNRLEDQLARACGGLLVCDTDAFATTLWHERYTGALPPPGLWPPGGLRPKALYLLTGTAIPFEQDGTRSTEEVRRWMHGRFEEELARSGLPYLVVEGDRESRLALAVTRCDRLLATAR